MIWIILIVGAFFVIKWLASDSPNGAKSVTPPSGDVTVLGCECLQCGYGSPLTRKNAKGEEDLIWDMCYCTFQKCNVKKGSKCPYAEKHPDKLSKGVFDD